MKVRKIILYIDTKDNRRISVVLEIDGKKDEINKTTSVWTSQLLLPAIAEILQRNKISIFQITEIKIETGPGSFTGLRVGVAVANTLGWLLGIPVNGRKDKLAEPVYQ